MDTSLTTSPAARTVSIQRAWAGQLSAEQDDLVAVEEPLEISVGFGPTGARMSTTISVTMRTPGNDAELAAGLLVAEGVVRQQGDVTETQQLDAGRVRVQLGEGVRFYPNTLARRGYTSSACGVCGKISLDTGQALTGPPLSTHGPRLASVIITRLSDTVREAQAVFDATGGLHAAALFDANGTLWQLREDVGRHNAVDKLIGAAFLGGTFPCSDNLLFLSGRVSFELVQKAVMAGIPVIAAVGAPSSYAVEMADEHDLTLLGFVRGERFNIYTGAWRVQAE